MRRRIVAVFVMGLMVGALLVPAVPAFADLAADLKTALGISDGDITRLQNAVGWHQGLTDDAGSPRAATVEEAKSEIISRVNALVVSEESKRDLDLGQWGE